MVTLNEINRKIQRKVHQLKRAKARLYWDPRKFIGLKHFTGYHLYISITIVFMKDLSQSEISISSFLTWVSTRLSNLYGDLTDLYLITSPPPLFLPLPSPNNFVNCLSGFLLRIRKKYLPILAINRGLIIHWAIRKWALSRWLLIKFYVSFSDLRHIYNTYLLMSCINFRLCKLSYAIWC